ncbi:hypothetical protein CRI94_17275 [Longibacter salinarum]|uniref:Helix-turn-helix domain-containing protein n=1 Tax=Longibacter salinarum TaxID=1850348 RepID=A0A2A8CTG5_9BACT|nr:helix-turn-helix domain-containing protein [Longibacter salinarum]PEN10369.1 hypothetical protein CRI94_17275 [Longibacter salinarum]
MDTTTRHAPADVGKRHYNAREVAEKLDITTRTVRNHIKQGELPAAKIGRSFVITRDDLAEYLGGHQRVVAIFGPLEDDETRNSLN